MGQIEANSTDERFGKVRIAESYGINRLKNDIYTPSLHCH